MYCAERQGADPRELAREAALPGWALEDDDLRYLVAQLGRLWQVTAARLRNPRIGLHVGSRWRLGDCHLPDYVFDTSATLGEAFATAFRYTPLLNRPGPTTWPWTTPVPPVSSAIRSGPRTRA
jgi:hypothetical protein